MKSVLYNILDVLTFSRGIKIKMNGFKFRMPTKWYRYYNDGYEKDSFDYIRENVALGETVLDIGSHIGLYTIPFSQLVGEKGLVFCFEPTNSTFNVLKKTIKINNLQNTKPLNFAISNKDETLFFNLTTDTGEGSNANSLVNIDNIRNTQEVIARSIDSIRDEYKLKIDFIKIDVEGAEYNALLGAEKCFLNDKPMGILGLHPKMIAQNQNTLEQIWELLMSYNCSVFYNSNIIMKDFFVSQTNLFDITFKCK
jgi:FkbM family methyltransferase